MAKQKQTVKLKEPVRIRFKQLSNGNQSIYLDYYTGDVIRKENYVGGKRKYEFLKLYLIPERTREDKAKNEATLALAKAIQSKRIVEVQNDAHGFQNTNKSRVNLLDYLENIGKQSAEQGSRNYARTVLNTVRALKLFRGDYIAFRDVDKEFLSEFTDFLRQMPKASKYGVLKSGGRLSNNSVVSYYGTLRTAINRAYKEGIIAVNPTKEFDFASKSTTGTEPPRVSDNRRVEDADKYRMPTRDCQAGLSVQLLVWPARQRHSQIEVVRPATERRTCPYRNHDAEN